MGCVQSSLSLSLPLSSLRFGFLFGFSVFLSLSFPPLNETPRASRSSAALSAGSDAALIEQFTMMSREFSAMVVAGSAMQLGDAASNVDNETPLVRIGEENHLEETYPLAIVPDTNPIPSPRRAPPSEAVAAGAAALEEVSVVQAKKEEVESKISAWQTAEVAKVNNRGSWRNRGRGQSRRRRTTGSSSGGRPLYTSSTLLECAILTTQALM